jgi:hypothetical protein
MMNFTVDCVRGHKDGVVVLITADAGEFAGKGVGTTAMLTGLPLAVALICELPMHFSTFHPLRPGCGGMHTYSRPLQGLDPWLSWQPHC